MITGSGGVKGQGTSGTAYSAELELNIYELFDRQVRMNPNGVAVVVEGGAVTYAQLAGQANSICRFLTSRSIVGEQPVGILMHRSAHMLATMLAVLKLGAAYLPLDPEDPMVRHQKMIAISGCRIILTDSVAHSSTGYKKIPGCEGQNIQILKIDRNGSCGLDDTPVPTASGGDRLAYILFTSGSTGEPKGVEVEHRSVINLLMGVRDLIGFSPSDRYLAVATIAFDISVVEIFLPLVCGGSLLLRDRKLLAEAGKLADEISRHKVSIMQTGASLWASILSEKPEFPRLRVAISTSEAISPALALKLVEYGDQAWNLYGPTEATVWATGYRLTRDSCRKNKGSDISAPIGQGIAHATIHVLDRMLAHVARGETGELYIGGPGLARGYLNNSQLTDIQFITHPETGERLYRTGDLVSWNSDNQLEYLGRIDDQVQVRGVRVEPREVESAILCHPDVHETAATWYETTFGSRSIAAAVVLKRGKALTTGEVPAGLAGRLPAQMIPSKYVFKESLALTGSGKIDRNAIRQDVATVSRNERSARMSRLTSTTEGMLTRIWQRLLMTDSIRPEDHFFSIGGDSLAAARMIMEAEAVFEVVLTVQMVYENPVLEKLAARIDRIRGEAVEKDESSYIFQLTGEGDGRPVFFNNVNLTMATGGKWNLPCPLYSISYWAKGAGFLEVDTLEELASKHIAGIRKIQPHGPYRLAGYSFGGLIAYEIARQLTELSEIVESLFLVEPREPDHIKSVGESISSKTYESAPSRISRHVRAMLQHPDSAVAYIGHRLMPTIRVNTITRWLAYKIVHIHTRQQNPVSRLLVPKNQWPAIKFYIDRLVNRYVARPYSGPVRAVFGDYSEFGYTANTWAELIGNESIFHIPEARHHGFFSEPVLGQWMTSLADGLGTVYSERA